MPRTCTQCWNPIPDDAEWPDSLAWEGDAPFHDGCLDMHLSEDAKAFQARVEALPVRVGRENAGGGARVTGRPVVACNCERDAGEIPCPVHSSDGRWAE